MKRILLIPILLLLSILIPRSALKAINFSHISIEDGLSQSTVYAIAQDSRGFMWFGTADGLNYYNGYQITTYKHDYSDSLSLADNTIRCLYIDSSKVLWVGTLQGLQRYDAQKDCFRRIAALQNMQVNSVHELDSVHLLVGTEQGLMLVDKATQTVTAYVHINSHELAVKCIARVDGYFLVGTTQGLYHINIDKSEVSAIAGELSQAHVMAIAAKNNTRIWVATEGQGLYCFNPQTQWQKRYRYSPRSELSISSNYVRCLAFDSSDALWVGTIKGLSIYDEQKDGFYQIQANRFRDGSLSQNSIRSMCLDNQGGMWIGTFYGGVNYFNPLYYNFENIYYMPLNNTINDNVVNAIVEDKNQVLWIGTNDHGLNSYNPQTQKYTSYEQVSTGDYELNTNHIITLCANPDGTIWMGTHGGGLMHLNPATRAIAHYNATGKPRDLVSNDVYSILRDSRNTLWIATLNGLQRMNEQSKQFTLFERDEWNNTLPSKRIFMLFEDSKRKVWIGTDKGVGVYYLEENRVESFTFSPQDPYHTIDGTVRSIYEDSRHTLWIGTTTGLYKYNEKEKNFDVFTVKNGLHNDVINGILEDNFGRLWLSTNQGLSCFTPDSKTFTNYYSSDGIRNYQFNPGASCKTKQGRLYFGGTHGLTSFLPNKITSNPYTPAAVITQLKLFNNTVNVDDKTQILSRHISVTSAITLKPSQSSFSLEFAVPNYLSGRRNIFAYKLLGFDKDWFTGERNSASYSNLSEGTYTFMLKVANNDGVWSDTVTQLQITVLPHWYASRLAFFLYIAVFLACAYVGYSVYKNRSKMQRELELERINRVQMEEMNQMKLRFFINMSHEFRTPLTLIISPLRDILNSGVKDGWLRKRLELIYSNAQRMLLLVQQLIDYRRAELGVFKLRAGKLQNLPTILNDIYKSFNELARQKHIGYTLDIAPELESQACLFDAHYIERILFNLLSNAFKFTANGGMVRLKAELQDEQLCLSVTDTGCGMDKEEQARIFDRFYQKNPDNIGTGIGLSLVKSLVESHHGTIEVSSSPGQGSEFTVRLPQREQAYTADELDEASNEPMLSSITPDMVNTIYNTDNQDIIKEGRSTILIAEDNREMADYLQERFKEKFNVLLAQNGEEALAKLAHSEVDLVITDAMMPVMDGLKLTKHLKQNIKTCHIPVIMLSAKAMVEDQLSGLSVGADDYIPKPFSFSVLESKVSNILRSRRRMSELYAQNVEIAPEKVTFNALDEELLKKALDVVNQNIDNVDFTVDDFGRAMAMSRSNLHLKLKAITGESATDFIRRVRFQYASKLLREGRHSVTEISYMAGFNSPSYFATSFKKYFGCLPTEYAVRNRGAS